MAPLAGGLLAGLCSLYFYGKPRKKISRKETDEKEALELMEKEETTEKHKQKKKKVFCERITKTIHFIRFFAFIIIYSENIRISIDK